MTLRHLTIFLAVADYGSMSAAASHLYLSQPTISQAIRELETHYQGLLFERLGKKLYLTDRGKSLLVNARPLIAEFEQLEELMMNQRQSSTLKLGTSITVGTCLAPSLITNMEQAIPGLDIYSFVSNTQEIEQKLLRSELDAAIVEGNITSSDLVVTPIIDDCLVLACSRKHPFFEKDFLHPQDLNGQSFAMREPGSGTRNLFETYIQRHSISIRVKWEANSPRTLINAVLQNETLSVMSFRLMRHDIRHDNIKVFYNETGEWARSFKLVYHKNKFLTPPIYELEKMLKRCSTSSKPEKYSLLKAAVSE